MSKEAWKETRGEEIGECSWCSEPLNDDDDVVPGNRGEGWMHRSCRSDSFSHDYHRAFDQEESEETNE